MTVVLVVLVVLVVVVAVYGGVVLVDVVCRR